jgi:hypothetical protein
MVVVALWIALATFPAVTGAWAGDRHAGYYYPEPSSREVYQARSQTLPNADRATRIGFVTGIAKHISEQPYPPQAVMFAKGAEAEKLIIVALVDGRIDTLYRARAVLANMTAAARMLPAFQEMGVQDTFTFLDLAKMLGFKQITISDGRDFAHQLTIE